jgi:hypothetical protein
MAQSDILNDGFVLIDKATNQPIVGLAYRINLPNGDKLEGITNEAGRTLGWSIDVRGRVTLQYTGDEGSNHGWNESNILGAQECPCPKK